MRSRRRTVLCASLAAAACGGPAGVAPPGAPSSACRLLAPSDPPGAAIPAIDAALRGLVDPEDAPKPHSDAERFLFRHLYGTVIRVDCQGRTQPGLAAEWRVRDGGRVWSFVLREAARFGDGARVTATDVIAGWMERRLLSEEYDGGIRWLAAESNARLRVVLNAPVADMPGRLADPRFAVTGQPAAPWPRGSGAYRLESMAAAGGLEGGAPRVRVWTASPTPGVRGPRLRLHAVGEADPRDLLDRGLDLLITSDPGVIEYIATRPEFVGVPLPWDRVYVLVVPGRRRAAGAAPAGEISLGFLEDLAVDALRVEARVPRSTPWWGAGAGSRCLEAGAHGSAASVRLRDAPPRAGRVVGSAASGRRLVFPAEDGVARSLSGRLVALVAAGPSAPGPSRDLAAAVPELFVGDPGPLVAAGLDTAALAGALEKGGDVAYVLPLPARSLDRCGEIDRLRARMPWLRFAGEEAASLLPLVETRSTAFVRRPGPGLWIDWDGTPLLFDPAGGM